MQAVEKFWSPISASLADTAGAVWGLPLVIFLMGSGLVLAFHSRLHCFRGLPHALALVRGRFHHKSEENAEGQITHFQALSNALAATVGLGNIGGVAVAIGQGGAGAVFWMWLAAVIGMNTKFFECSLSLFYRGHDYQGEVQGGPMYVIIKALPSKFKFLAYFFAVCGLIGTLSLFQSNQLAHFLEDQFSFSPWMVGIACSVSVIVVLSGGLKLLARVTSSLVPSMCLLYIVGCLIILLGNFSEIPIVLMSIFRDAFTGQALIGGATGVAFAEIMKIGIRRAAFSNEAGMGTAPMAHGNAKTAEPISEGLVAALGPLVDTLIICTMTALVILLYLKSGGNPDQDGVVLTTAAFEQFLGKPGIYLLTIAIFAFSFSTMIGMANYNIKCYNFIFKGRFIFKEPLFIVVYASTLFVGAIVSADDAVNIIDIGFALMCIPNLLATLYLAPKVKVKMEEYLDKYVRA